MDKFFRELPRRVQEARQDPSEQRYARYVRWGRCQRRISREELANRSGLEQSFLGFLENEVLYSGELTREVKTRIEQALGIPYRVFLLVWWCKTVTGAKRWQAWRVRTKAILATVGGLMT